MRSRSARLLDRYEKMRIREGPRIKALPKAMRALRRTSSPGWRCRPPVHQGRSARRPRRLVDAGMIAANRFLASFGPVMRWAAQEDLIPHNFVPAIRRRRQRESARAS